MQQVRTLTPNNPPGNGMLLEGQLSIEYNPPRLWAGGPGGTTNVQLAGVTGVTAGTGLTGGGASGAVTLNLATPVAVAHGGTGATSFPTALPSLTGAQVTPVVSSAVDGSALIGSTTWGFRTDTPYVLEGTLFLNAVGAPSISWVRSRGTPGSPLPVQSGDALGGIIFGGYPYLDVPGIPGCDFRVFTTQNWSPAGKGARFELRTTPNNTTNMRLAMVLEHDGSLQLPVTPLAVGQGGTGARSFPIALPSLTGAQVTPVVSSAVDGSSLVGSAYWGFRTDTPFVLEATLFSNTPSAPSISWVRARGTPGSPQPILMNDSLGGIIFGGYPYLESPPNIPGCDFRAFATQNWTTTPLAKGTQFRFYTTPNNTGNTRQALTIDNDGTVILNPTFPTALALNVGATGWMFLGRHSDWTGMWLNTTATPWSWQFSGNITANNFPSDSRLKEQVADYPHGLEAIRKMQPISWKWNGLGGMVKDGKTYCGLSADELQEFLPEAVDTIEEPPKPNLPEGYQRMTDIKTVDDRVILDVLINAIKELDARVHEIAATRS